MIDFLLANSVTNTVQRMQIKTFSWQPLTFPLTFLNFPSTLFLVRRTLRWIFTEKFPTQGNLWCFNWPATVSIFEADSTLISELSSAQPINKWENFNFPIEKV